MSSKLLLDDGRALWRSNLGNWGMLYLISQEISAPDAPLRIWLIDMSNRASPFCEFDIQGIPVSARQEFWAYASRAWVKI